MVNLNILMEKLKNVMLVDDDDSNIFLYRMILERSGLVEKITAFTDEWAALAELNRQIIHQEKMPELLFLDVHFRELNAWTFLERLASTLGGNTLETIIVVMTASIDPNHQEIARNHSLVKEYRTKPLTKNILKEIIHKYFLQVYDLKN